MYQLTHLDWIVTSVLYRNKKDEDPHKIPGWLSYNSLLSTQVGAWALHEWSPLLTVMTQAQSLKEMAVGKGTIFFST